MSTNIDIYVSRGNLASPYYQFFLDSSGNSEITSLNLNSNLTYTFRRLDEEITHPFYISDSGVGNDSSSSISISGDGSATSGIRGDQSLTVTFNKEQIEISELTFYCTSHPSMQSSFYVQNWDPYTFKTRSKLNTAVDLWIRNERRAIRKFGDINTWDVSGIDDFSYLFSGSRNLGAASFNSDISNWDVSSVTNFSAMFMHNEVFNHDIGSWDVSNGTDFSDMFMDADAFNKDLSNWDVSSGTNFSGMFEGNLIFNKNIKSWDVSSGINFNYMFENAGAFNQDISSWNVSAGNNFESMLESDLMTANGWSATPTSSDFLGQTIRGNATAEKINGAAGNDILSGLGGNDKIVGKNGWDKLFGGGGNDKLFGGGKDDLLSGGGGKDKLNGGFGEDILTGGDGKDTFYLSVNTGRDTITDYQSKDKLKLTGGITENDLKIKQAGDNVKIKYDGDLMAIVEDTLIAELTFI